MHGLLARRFRLAIRRIDETIFISQWHLNMTIPFRGAKRTFRDSTASASSTDLASVKFLTSTPREHVGIALSSYWVGIIYRKKKQCERLVPSWYKCQSWSQISLTDQSSTQFVYEEGGSKTAVNDSSSACLLMGEGGPHLCRFVR
jgi:hypothetical protein